MEERRDPLGAVLVIGPAYYLYSCRGGHALQVLVAANAVISKLGHGGTRVIRALRQMAIQSGLPDELGWFLGEDVPCAQSIIAEVIDKIVLTGSVKTGRAVYRRAAEHLIPLVLELSGCDPVFVQEGADLQRVAANRLWCAVERRKYLHCAATNFCRRICR